MRWRYGPALALLLGLSAAVAGADPAPDPKPIPPIPKPVDPIGPVSPAAPPVVKGKPGRPIRLTVPVPDGKTLIVKPVFDEDENTAWDEIVGPPGTRKFSLNTETVGKYPVLLWFKGEDEAAVKTTFDVAGPAPPTPPVPPGPNPPVPPTPVGENPFGAQPGLRVLIVAETAEDAKLPAGQLLVLRGRKMRDYLDAKCVADGYRMFDPDVKPTADEWWVTAMKRTDRKSLPWIYVGKEATGFSGPLPADVDGTIALISKYAGS